MSPRKVRPTEPDPLAELRAAVGMEPRVELGNDAAIRGQLELDNESEDERDQ